MKNTMPSFENCLKPFEPYIKRYGFGYVHFINGTFLFSKEFSELIKELWNKDLQKYNENSSDWCKRNII